MAHVPSFPEDGDTTDRWEDRKPDADFDAGPMSEEDPAVTGDFEDRKGDQAADMSDEDPTVTDDFEDRKGDQETDEMSEEDPDVTRDFEGRKD